MSAASPSSATPIVKLGVWRARTFARAEDAERYTATLIQRVEHVRARAAALEALATRYGERDVQLLSPASQQKLHGLVEAHHRDLVHDVVAADDQLGLLLGSSTRSALTQTAGDDWRTRAAEASAATNNLHDALNRLLREDDLSSHAEGSNPAGERVVNDLRRVIGDLCRLFESPVGR